MAKRGRKPDLKRREEARALRRQGLTLPETGRRMGITPQAAHLLVRAVPPLRPIHCRSYGNLILQGEPGINVLIEGFHRLQDSSHHAFCLDGTNFRCLGLQQISHVYVDGQIQAFVRC